MSQLVAFESVEVVVSWCFWCARMKNRVSASAIVPDGGVLACFSNSSGWPVWCSDIFHDGRFEQRDWGWMSFCKGEFSVSEASLASWRRCHVAIELRGSCRRHCEVNPRWYVIACPPIFIDSIMKITEIFLKWSPKTCVCDSDGATLPSTSSSIYLNPFQPPTNRP